MFKRKHALKDLDALSYPYIFESDNETILYDPITKWEDEFDTILLSRILLRLNDREREIVEHIVYDRMRYSEIGRLMNLSYGIIKQTVFRMRVRMHHAIDKSAILSAQKVIP